MTEEAKAEADKQYALRMQLLEKVDEYEKSFEDPQKTIPYGEHGFRDEAKNLDRLAFRVGLFTGIRSRVKGTYGIMVSGGHREHEINGVKIIEPDGRNLDKEWREMAEIFMNTCDIEFSLKNLNELTIKQFPLGINIFEVQQVP